MPVFVTEVIQSYLSKPISAPTKAKLGLRGLQ